MAAPATIRRAWARSLRQRVAVARVERAIRSAVRPPRSRYLAEFAAAFRGFEAVIPQAEVVARAAAADIVLVGDYHSLAACQRFTTELVGQLAACDSRPMVLGMEAVYSASQRLLEDWWRGAVDDECLCTRLHFARDWGYDWEPYRELFCAARRNCAAVWGLDSQPRFDLRRVRMRDRHMADRILAMREGHPQARLVIFVGESHLAPSHLPRLLAESLPGEHVLTLLQNVDALYWQASATHSPLPEAVSVSQDCLCVLNASPLEKYESYQEYLERWLG